MPIAVVNHADRYLATIAHEPHVFHCHHYNCFLQQSILEQRVMVDVEALLINAAVEVVYPELAELKADASVAEALFRQLGFGVLDTSGLSASGGHASVRASHYALGWLSRYGRATEPMCFFVAGFVEAVARQLFGHSFEAREKTCLAKGDASCTFEVVRKERALEPSPGLGRWTEFALRPGFATNPRIDEAAIINACSQLPLAGNSEGRIDVFGVSLTRHYANYYNLVSYRLDRQMEAVAGSAASEATRLLLTEAGQVCAFHTFGGIMESAEWEALVKPMCQTREDWVHGMVSVVNALGWGRWSVASLEAGQRLELVVDGSYESNGYLAGFGASQTPRCALATGGTAGLMALLYQSDITSRPRLTPELYRASTQEGRFFVSREVECRTMGAKACRFVAERV